MNFSEQAKQWEENVIKTRRNLWLRRRRLKKFNFKNTDKILDLGCGDGLDIWILAQMGIINIIGIDISQKLLIQAKKLNPKAKFVFASAENMPFKSNSFDCVLADSVLYHFVNNLKALKEIVRVLKPRGRLCFVEAHNSLLRKILDNLTFNPYIEFIPFFRARKQAYMVEEKAIKSWSIYESRFLGDLEKVGLAKKSVTKDFFSVIGIYRKI